MEKEVGKLSNPRNTVEVFIAGGYVQFAKYQTIMINLGSSVLIDYGFQSWELLHFCYLGLHPKYVPTYPLLRYHWLSMIGEVLGHCLQIPRGFSLS